MTSNELLEIPLEMEHKPVDVNRKRNNVQKRIDKLKDKTYKNIFQIVREEF